MRRLLTPFVAALLGLGCQATPPATLSATPVPEATSAPVNAAAVVTATVSGIAKAPAGIISVVGGVIPTGGGNVLPTGGGNVVPTGGGLYRLEAVSQAPLANTQVVLADAQGQAYAGIAPTTTDANGAFTFQGVPRDLTVMVVASAYDSGRKKAVTLRTLVNPAKGGDAPVVVDAASSIVTADVVQGRTELGGFNNTAFQAAATATAERLADTDLPDFSDQSALAARADALAAADANLKAQLDQTRQELQTLKDELARLEELLRHPPSPPPTAAPAATATPAPVATTAAPTTPTPAPGGTPAPTQPPPGPVGPPPNCSTFVTHAVHVRGNYPAYPLTIQVFAPGGNNPVATTRIPAKDGFGTLSLPEGCAHRWEVYGPANQRVGFVDNWTVPVGAPYDIFPPL